MEAFVLLWVGEGGRQRAVGKCRQLQVLAKQGGGALLHYHHLAEEQQQTKKTDQRASLKILLWDTVESKYGRLASECSASSLFTFPFDQMCLI